MSNDLATRQAMPSERFTTRSEAEALSTELAKMLGLVAPVTMSTDQQKLWIVSAVDALRDIRASEVANISTEVRRSVTRHSQIVPKIAELVAAARSREHRISQISAPRDTPLPPTHIADRDRRTFVAADWAELNVHLERIGAGKRYGPDGTRYDAPGSKPLVETGTGSIAKQREPDQRPNSGNYPTKPVE